ncbi:hypothetical protein ACC743_38885, partial [Rhizobium ruizarguesonis]
VEETAAALEEITTTVRDAAKRTEEASQLVARTRLGAEKSVEIVRKAVSAMQQIEKLFDAVASGDRHALEQALAGGARLMTGPLI